MASCLLQRAGWPTGCSTDEAGPQGLRAGQDPRHEPRQDPHQDRAVRPPRPDARYRPNIPPTPPAPPSHDLVASPTRSVAIAGSESPRCSVLGSARWSGAGGSRGLGGVLVLYPAVRPSAASFPPSGVTVCAPEALKPPRSHFLHEAPARGQCPQTHPLGLQRRTALNSAR